jgi:hypothetical protein
MQLLILLSVIDWCELFDKNPYKEIKARVMEVVEKIMLDLLPAGMVYCKHSSFAIEVETYWDSNIMVVLSIVISKWPEFTHNSH